MILKIILRTSNSKRPVRIIDRRYLPQPQTSGYLPPLGVIGGSGKISGSSLEGSNTDIADEFTKLIVTQQAYSANTKVITTANQMVQDLLNVLR